jgi:hypothetical protein
MIIDVHRGSVSRASSARASSKSDVTECCLHCRARVGVGRREFLIAAIDAQTQTGGGARAALLGKRASRTAASVFDPGNFQDAVKFSFPLLLQILRLRVGVDALQNF